VAGTQKLVIVESPTKARTIRQYLGGDYRVEASMGHVRDLPANADEIPAKIKDREWARLGVDIEQGFEPIYVVPSDKKKVVSELKKALKNADELYLATDEDREGESIGWHLLQVLKPKVPTRRMVFHEITPEAIQAALESPREIDDQLVAAQETRRVLDRLVGYIVSPLLWKKVAPRLSAGRVQSVAVRMLVLRERERIAFRSGSYWDLKARFTTPDQSFEAQLVNVDGQRVATGRDFDENTGRIIDGRDVLLLEEPSARQLVKGLTDAPFTVRSVERKTATRHPAPPFTTSTLQQEANRKLGFGARTTMQVAQRLYENGLITYMRTDSVHLSDQAITAARNLVGSRYGEQYLSDKPRQYATKSKGAQEAHEAIRPAGTEMRTVEDLGLNGPEARLYELIWKRTVATQMAEARLAFTTVLLAATDAESGQTAEFRASGREVVFPGFFRAYVEGSDDPDEALDDQSRPLPALAENQNVPCSKVEPIGHETKPPARYTEATLVKALEAAGIGRPSTYATIIDTIQNRGYVVQQARQLVPTFTAMAVTSLLEQTHGNVVDLEFTAAMEQRLDAIADHEDSDYLEEFYHRQLMPGLDTGAELDPRDVCSITHENIAPWTIRVGRYGPYVEVFGDDGKRTATVSLPDETAPGDVDRAMIEKLVADAQRGDEPLGLDPETNESVFVLTGRFGPYVQRGERSTEKGAPKPKRVSLPKGVGIEDVTLELALDLLSLPRTLGTHPDDGEPIKAGIGQYGPYVVHKRTYASLKKEDDVLTVALDRALELLAAKAAGRRGAAREALRELGEHPEDGKPVVILDGRYGPYVKHNRTNASLPDGTAVESFTMAQAVELLAAKKAAPKKRGGGRRKR
jgi:DNA topoisomerase-1